MQRLPQPPKLPNKENFTLWLVICLSVLPMTVPVFAAFSNSSNNSGAPVNGLSQLAFNEDGTTARPLKAELVDNEQVSPAVLDVTGDFAGSAPDVVLALLAVLYIAYLGWRFTLRQQMGQ